MTMISTPPESNNDDLSPLLSEPFARAWAAPAPGVSGRLAERLGQRLAESLKAEEGMVTVRRRKSEAETLGEGVQQRVLYQAPSSRAARPGEPRAASIIELQAGAQLTLPVGGAREFLVLRGSVGADGETLGLHDFLRLPAGMALHLSSEDGGHVFVREAEGEGGERTLVRDREAGWPEFAPGIARRVLWTAGGEAALLYRADPGAQVPGHGHGHDEECLTVQGEIFLDDVLLQAGDYQLAPAGSGHVVTETDTGVIIYAHGDLDLQFS
ncbi:cupin domain-containing protein [Roseateles sp.]|uniref:cupin domain-containing protein n=1 Tax=Roseateles sp. TaxID=1971397 RepID=UPI0032647E4F